MSSSTKLRNVTLCGPDCGPATARKPFWEITVGAPYVFKEPPSGINEDKIHPLRSLVIDNKALAEKDGFRKPRLISAHVIAGHSGAIGGNPGTNYEPEFFDKSDHWYDYKNKTWPPGFQERAPGMPNGGKYFKEFEGIHEKLRMRIDGGTTITPSKMQWEATDHGGLVFSTPAYFLTGTAKKGGETVLALQAAEFQHVVASPILNETEDWPQSDKDDIDLPSMRLVAGALNLAVAEGGLDWLKGLKPPVLRDEPGNIANPGIEHIWRYNVRLVPDGIELELDVPFPGQASLLRGCFLLAPEGAALVLTLLPEKLTAAQAAEWRKAWQEALPDEAKVEALHGFRLDGNRNALPRFRWRAAVKDSAIQKLTAVVEVPAEDLRMTLVSPRGASGVDGVVSVGGSGFFILTTLAAAKLEPAVATHLCGSMAGLKAFAKSLGDATLLYGWEQADANAKYVLSLLAGGSAATPAQLDVSLDMPANAPYPCSHNAHRLAQALRESYGLDTPAAGATDVPALYGFVPMVDGWLQLPVPNLAPVDPQLDSELLALPVTTAKNALDGYLRFSQNGELPDVLSGFEPPSSPLVETAPWSVTVESASGLRAVVAVAARGAAASGAPVRGLARVDEPELSTRGLLWLSADRPDDLEALPRMGAGPAAFIDVPMERQDSAGASPFAVALSKLQLKAVAADGPATVTREALSLKINRAMQVADQPPVYWRRHARMPLASAMPMTRSATSALRPLESRDLVPFDMAAAGNAAAVQPLAELSWSGAAAVYPALEGNWKYSVAQKWPWPGNKPMGDPEAVKGIGLFALGVPGVELRLDEGVFNAGPWTTLQAALRYDLPALDEAFATATMPPPADGTPAPRTQRVSEPAPTALDWPRLRKFWAEQERRLQQARVAHSYVADFKKAGDIAATGVTSMIRGWNWTIPLGFSLPPAGEPLPYGSITLNAQEQSGNQALRGFDGTLPMPGTTQDISVTGYSPTTLSIKGVLYDARGYGAGAMTQPAGGLWRPLDARDPLPDQLSPVGRITSLEPVAVRPSQTDTATELFSFWFKDIPLDASGVFEDFSDPAVSVTVRAWQDGPLMSRGAEWRLIDPLAKSRDPGIDRVDFHGLQLEPLRLRRLSFAWDAAKAQPKSAQPLAFTILARVYMGPVLQTDRGGNNLVLLEFAQTAGVVWLRAITVVEGPGLSLPVEVKGQRMSVGIASIAWTDGVLGLEKASMSFDFLERQARLDGVSLEHHEGGWIAVWVRPQAALAAQAVGRASIHIEHAALTVEALEASFDLTHRTVLTPGPATAGAALSGDAMEVSIFEGWGDSGYQHSASLRLFGLDADVMYTPERGGFSVTAFQAKVGAAMLNGFPAFGLLTFGMVSSVELDGRQWMAGGSARLVAGRFAGSLEKLNDSECMALERIDFEASCSERGAPGQAGEWSGAITLYGVIKVRSAIGWPKVTGPASGIPFPDKNLKTGCIDVVIDAGTTCVHDVQWLLDGHRLPFAIAQGIAEGMTGALWTVPVLARHQLKTMGDGETQLAFTSVETIAIGAIAAVVPEWKSSEEAENQGTTFVPRYRYPAAATKKNPLPPLPGAVSAGEGTVGTVLQGALGASFRTALYKNRDGSSRGIDLKSTAICGGFIGMLAPAKSNGDAVLMRLPVLAGLSGGSPLYVPGAGAPLFLQAGDGKPVSVSWPDSTVAARVALTSRSAATPRDSSGPSLLEAAGASAGDTVMEALVEQAFPVKLADPGLDKTAYFLSAAISIARTIESCRDVAAPVALSLIAGNKRAAALLVPYRAEAATPHVLPPRAELMLAGDDLVTQAWTAPAAQRVDAYAGIIAGRAYTAHARPRVAMLRDAAGAFYRAELPLRTLQPKERQAQKIVFEDASRGYPLALGADTGDWLGGAHEGITTAMRDSASGIPGMSRVARMPAHAASMEPTSGMPQPLNDMVWIGQQRVPVYLPLRTSVLQSPPIPWLVPGAPRTRLPVASNVESALRPLGVLKPADAQEGVSRSWQPYLASEVMTAAISDRPGILMVRRLRLEKATGDAGIQGLPDFDPESGTYGRPAQASISQPRTERTPRPGKLPANTHADIEYWRRPCASPMLPMVPLRALVGPADVVRGTMLDEEVGKVVERQWSVTFIAAPSTAGMVTASWDGTLEMLAEIDISPAPAMAANGGGPASWKDWFAALVCGAPGEMSATLTLGRTAIAFRALHIRNEIALGSPDTPAVLRGHVRLVLDARSKPGAFAGPAMRAIADALSAAEGVPRAEVRWTVRPLAGAVARGNPLVPAPASIDLGQAKGAELAGGPDRAPTTLVIALSPVLRGRGALPLEPSSLLFIDPAYDAGLAAPPVEDAKRLQLPAPTAGGQLLPKGRGDLMFILACDRQRANRKATLTLMADMRFERPLDARARANLPPGVKADGDLKLGYHPDLALTVRVQPRAGTMRELGLASATGVVRALTLKLAVVHELPLANLLEADGTPAQLEDGDIVEVVVQCLKEKLQVLDAGIATDTAAQAAEPSIVEIASLYTDSAPTRTIRAVLTDEPVIEPPSASYAALVRAPAVDGVQDEYTLSLPLYAQSPLPHRVDLQDAKADFRAGLLRRNATFIWTLTRSRAETNALQVHVVKSDRNGQTYLPESEKDFVQPHRSYSMTTLYQVPGIVEIQAQPDDYSCWATAFTMLKAWKMQTSFDIAKAVATVGPRYSEYFIKHKGLPASEFGAFLTAAEVSHQPQINLSVQGWVNQLKTHGLTWVGTMNSILPPAGLHSRIVEGMEGDGTAGGTLMKIIDPDGGKRYLEAFTTFVKKYEDAFNASHDDQYFQIRFYL